MGTLAGKRCLIVGGTSGIGAASARRFLDEGASLVIAGPAAAELPRAHFLRCDVTRPDDIAPLFGEAIRSLGGLDVLLHVAGGSGRRAGDGALHECSDDGWRYTLDLNLRSVFLTNRAAV